MVAPRLVFLACLCATASATAAPLTCQLSDPAQKYLVDVLVAQPPAQSFDRAPAQITVRDKASREVLQRIDSADVSELLPVGEPVQALRCDEQKLVVFADFNFDGQQDLAVRNGNDGGYAAASYDIYLSDESSPVLVLNKGLSALTREPQLGLLEVDSTAKQLLTRSKSGCCWRQKAAWQMQGDTPQKVAETIEVAQAPSEAHQLMPVGYTDITDRVLQDGKWVEQRRLEGPVGLAPVMLRGKLDDKIAFELWWQVQGGVYVGEVRYTRGGNGKPIRLFGETYEDGGVTLHEFDDQGRPTGDWFVAGEPDEHGFQSGTWKNGEKSRTIYARPTAFRIAPQKFAAAQGSQREGRYVLATTDERSAWLTLKISPATDQNGGEVASVQMVMTQPGKPAIEVNDQWPLQAGNLIIGQKKLADPLYRLRLFDGAVSVEAVENYSLSGTYLKQP
ncbi:XAC2610-related protein [Pseudomonas sp. TWP3-1]|uniref:XAC2610-related protein n=1 Tax=Pseudomonas sp. TWP3-1 TaxID=2804631 RepID=UPI003CF630A8